MKKMQIKKRLPGLRGSFTVEAAFVIPLILMVLAMLIQMTLYLTDTVRLEAVMAEYALQESGDGNPDADGLFFLGGVTWETEDSDSAEKISGQATSTSVVFGKTIRWEASLSHERRGCAAALRRIYGLIQTAKKLRG